jgi:hypothetical protein
MPGRPRTSLAMPIEMKIGTRWDWRDGAEWKRFPSRDEFEATVRGMVQRNAA